MTRLWAIAAGIATAAGCITDGEVGTINRPVVTEVHVMARIDGQTRPVQAFGAGAAEVTTALAVRDQRITVVVSEPLSGADRFADGAAQVVCDGEPMPFITEGREQNQWNPETLTMSLIPRYLRTRAECTIAFADFVTDLDGNTICAPPDGDWTAACDGGDTSLIRFAVEPFALTWTSPADSEADVAPGATSVMLQFRPPIVETDDNLGHVHIADDAGPAPHTARVITVGDTQTIVVDVDDGLRSDTDYTVSIDGGAGGLLDITGGVLEQPELSLSFRTKL